MEHKIQVIMFGLPSITIDGSPLSLPYRQAEAILYYLFVNQSANKYTLADMIWEDKYTEEKIASSLRNAFYIIRKNLGRNFLLKENNHMIRINPEYSVFSDAALFLKEDENLELYKGDFLDGFFLKNNTAFNTWVENTRQFFRHRYLEKLQSSISSHFSSGNFDICETLCQKQIRINEFDETAYKYLMQIYLERKDYTQALHIYNRLELLLEQELFETPGKDIQELAAAIEKSRNKEIERILINKKGIASSEFSHQLFYGRTEELNEIHHVLNSLKEGNPFPHILISGEAGIGKTQLAQQAFSAENISSGLLLLHTRCYYAEEKYILKPWQTPAQNLLQYINEPSGQLQSVSLSQSIKALFPFFQESCSSAVDADDISTLDYKSIQSVFVHSLIQFSSTHPIVLFFDDFQWADELSVSLIRDIITSMSGYGYHNILFVFTARSNTAGSVRRFLEDMTALHKLKTFHLKRFNYEDTVRLASCLLPEYTFSDSLKKLLFHETEGNPLFISEAVNTIKYNGSPDDITPNMRNIIKQRISPVPSEYRQILNLVSIFFDGASYDCLAALSRKEDYELVEILEHLLEQNLLREHMDQNDTFFSFTHQKILEYVYDEMSWTKKRILHNKAGHYYETRLRGNPSDMALYPKLVYHFDRGANQQKYLKYAVKYLYNYLNVTHEFFPIIERNLTLFNLDMREETRERLSDDLGIIEELLYAVENKVNTYSQDFFIEDGSREEQLEILSDYLHMIGRHYIRICNYKKGLPYILRLKKLNREYNSSFRTEKLIQANRQLICVYINRYEPEKMEEITKESLALLKSDERIEEIAIWKRLQGLGSIMKGNLSHGIALLQEAIHIFSNSNEKEKHLYNLAAAYSWIGEAYRHSFDYKTAMEYYDKALEIAASNFLVSGVAVFYAYAGMAAYDSGNRILAQKYLGDSITHYEKGNLMWGRSIPYSYNALLLLEEKKWKEALQSLETALSYAKKLENPYEKGLVYRIFAQIKAGTLPFKISSKIPAESLSHNLRYYYRTALKYLENVFSPIDKKYLDEIKELSLN